MATNKDILIEILGDKPIAYHPLLAKALGGVTNAVFVSQLLYWTGRGKLDGGWIFKTLAEMEDETGLTRSNQETARKELVKLGVLEVARRGVPGKMHYRLDLDNLIRLLTMRKSHNVENQQCAMPESSNAQSGNLAKHNAETPQCIPETTAKTTPETTTHHGASAEKEGPKPKEKVKPEDGPCSMTKTPARRVLRAKFMAKVSTPNDRAGPKKFDNLAVAENFDKAAARLNGHLAEAIDCALEKAGINSITRIVNYIAVYDPARKGASGNVGKSNGSHSGRVPQRNPEYKVAKASDFDPIVGDGANAHGP